MGDGSESVPHQLWDKMKRALSTETKSGFCACFVSFLIKERGWQTGSHCSHTCSKCGHWKAEDISKHKSVFCFGEIVAAALSGCID